MKKIIHIDMDAYYASVEQLDNPDLKDKPIAVGGSAKRGVVAAASYEARKFGVRSALPSAKAARLCPDIQFIKPRFDRYRELSGQIREIFFDYTDFVEPLSLDEAYLDVTTNKIGATSALFIAKEIKQRIKLETGLVASAGISFNKFLAKTASDLDKPDGMYVILPEEAEDFVAKLPVHKFHGIGRVTAGKMVKAGIFTGKELRNKSLSDLTLRFGKAGKYYYNISRAIDNREVQPNRACKSVSTERTFEDNIFLLQDVLEALERIARLSFERYLRSGKQGSTITIKVKYGDFTQITRSKSVDSKIHEEQDFLEIAKSLFNDALLREDGIRLLGVGISNFKVDEEVAKQLTLRF